MEIKWSMPPIEKIYEAYSAIADDRIKIDENLAIVESSDYAKKYIVSWAGDKYISNDNASYWQGYYGYPVIAVLMLQDRLEYDNAVCKLFSKINWKNINKQYNNKYSKAVEFILTRFEDDGIVLSKIKTDVERIYEQLSTLRLNWVKSSTRPPS